MKRAAWLRGVLVWLGLLGLTGLTWGLSFATLGPWALPVALLIAVGKGSLVIVVFMRLFADDQEGSHRLIFLLALIFLVLLMTLVSADVATRLSLALPP